MALEASEEIQKVLDIWCRKILSDVIATADDLVIREAEENESVRDFFKGIVLEIPAWKWRGITGAIGMDARIDSCVQTVRVAE